MNTTMNNTSVIRSNKDAIEALKDALAQAKKDAYAQEEALLMDAAQLTVGTDGLTAAQISHFLNGQLTPNEIAQNFRFVGKASRLCSRYTRFGYMGDMTSRSVVTTRHFMEVDEQGQPLSGRILTRSDVQTVYKLIPRKD